MMAKPDFTPVIILGAGRSGTNMLRDVITALPEFGTWPCDEIQPVWRHGNLFWPDDMLTPDHARPKVRAFIRKQFHKQWRRLGKPAYLVEKTCANTLRVPFVDTVFPNAKFIQILRHGADVTKSAEKRWRGDMELPPFSYFMAKARFIPPLDLPVYLWAFLAKRVGLILGKSRQLSTWGPRFHNITDLQGRSLPEICARQWCASVQATGNSFEAIDDDRKLTIRYEDFVRQPDKELQRILAFLDFPVSADDLKLATGIVRRSTGKPAPCGPDIQKILAPCLTTAGYREES